MATGITPGLGHSLVGKERRVRLAVRIEPRQRRLLHGPARRPGDDRGRCETVHPQNEIFFSVPRDFHAHNDLVAAALMAVAGRGFTRRASTSRSRSAARRSCRCYHSIEEVGPVDPDLEPRRPGRYIGVAFSGGLDSLAVWTLLQRRCAGLVQGHHRRVRGLPSRGGRLRLVPARRQLLDELPAGARRPRPALRCAVPLLFADYADLHSFATGHQFASIPSLWNDPASREPAEFLPQNAVSAAGGLEELHLLRCLDTSAILTFLAQPPRSASKPRSMRLRGRT